MPEITWRAPPIHTCVYKSTYMSEISIPSVLQHSIEPGELIEAFKNAIERVCALEPLILLWRQFFCVGDGCVTQTIRSKRCGLS